MAYSDFTLPQVLDQFKLTQQSIDLFEQVKPIALSNWLRETLSSSQKIGLLSSTEKARSEFIVVPVLLELERQNSSSVAVYSGKRFDVDSSRGLNGECDFILGKGSTTHVIQAPVLALVEAKKQDIEIGLGQCAAQMVAAQIFNQNREQPIPAIFGCVTTAENWQFLKLEDKALLIEPRTYYLNELGKVLGILQTILDFYH